MARGLSIRPVSRPAWRAGSKNDLMPSSADGWCGSVLVPYLILRVLIYADPGGTFIPRRLGEDPAQLSLRIQALLSRVADRFFAAFLPFGKRLSPRCSTSGRM